MTFKSAWARHDHEVLKEFSRGPYIIRHENVRMNKTEAWTLMKSAYSPEGAYIGGTREAHRLWTRYGITKFFSRKPGGTAVVGFSPRLKKWFGWSHRAISGFKKGMRSKKGYSPNPNRDYVIRDARRAAFSFAEAVG